METEERKRPPRKQARNKGANKWGRAWQVMRVLRVFTVYQVAAAAEMSYDHAKHFALRLTRAGYLRRVRPRKRGQPGSYTVWKLIRNSGPQVPICWKDGRVYDPNLNQVFGPGAEPEREDR